VRVVIGHERTPSIGGAPRANVDTLRRVWVPSSSGGAVPLEQVSRVELEPSATTLRHYERQRGATVTAQVQSGFTTDRVTQAVITKLDALRLPEGVRVVIAGEVESRDESFGGMGVAVIVALFGVIAVLVLEFRTFRGTIVVASVIPLGAVGGLVALFLSGYTLSFTASIGFIALMGIEVKNSILLVDYTNQLRREGVGLDDAIRRAGETRFVPVLFTTLTALGGLIPLVVERSALYSPLAVVLVGGLVSSTLLARVVTPLMYRLLPPSVELDAESAVSEANLPSPQPV
jgi:multidrug efflux pump subunit AcrB